MQRRPLWRSLVAAGLAITFILGSTAAYVSAAKSIELVIDGEATRVNTMARTVDALLKNEGVLLGEYDVVTPAPAAALREGAIVDLRYARPLELEVDGATQVFWVTSRDLKSALTEAGVLDNRAWISASRSTPLGRQGLSVAVRLPKTLTIRVDGKRRSVVSTAPNLSKVLRDEAIKLGSLDRISSSLTESPTHGMSILITRVAQRFSTKDVVVKYPVKKISDKTMLQGKSVVKQAGRSGLNRITSVTTLENGRPVSRRVIKRESLKAPKSAVIVVGTKPRTINQLNWQALAFCESRGNPRAVSRGARYFGHYQFSLTAWKSVGGKGRASDASPSEQLMRAQMLYKKRGASPWPTCGRRLFT